jgi:RNA recognition motif-containing protein
MIRNRAVDPKRPRARPAFKKIFVGGIDADMPKEEIKNYFERFGTVCN